MELRSPPAYIAQQLFDVYVQLCASTEYDLPSPQDSTRVGRIAARCLELIQHARKAKDDKPIQNMLNAADFQILVENNRDQFNPVISFLIGAGVWWKVSEFDDFEDELVKANDLPPKGSSFLFVLDGLTLDSHSRSQSYRLPYSISR